MPPEITIALIQLIAKVGLDAAIAITENLSKSVTIDDAIAALKAAKDKTAQMYLADAKAQIAPPTP